jgi:hypothetical protein
MTRRWLARFCSLAAAMSIASSAKAGVWGTQPVIGITGDYATNPALIDIPDTAETHGAVLLDAPTTYNSDAFKLTILPSFRFGNTQGYSSVDSDYEHLTVGGEFDTPLDVFTASGTLARDSSLYRDYLLSGSAGVRRDMATADLNWDRHLTERLEIDTDVNSSRVDYGEATGYSTLVDYKYTSVTPTLTWAESERTKLTLAGDAGRYDSLDGTTQSINANAQVGVIQQLSELWSLTASAGYSRAYNRVNTDEAFLEFTPQGPIIVVVPVTFKSTQNGSVYSVNLTRQTELLQLVAIASRQLTPTGFVFLTRQENYEVRATYTPTERWSLTGGVHRVDYQQPQINGALVNLNITNAQISASWQWTENWTLSMTALRVIEHYGSPSLPISNSEFSLELARHFDWKSLP